MVCRQEYFPSAAAPREDFRRRKFDDLASSGRRLHDRAGTGMFRGFVIFQGLAGRKISRPFSAARICRGSVRDDFGDRLSSGGRRLVRETALAIEFAARPPSSAPSPSRPRNARPQHRRLATRQPPCIDRNGSASVRPNGKCRGVLSWMRLPIAEGTIML